MKISSHNGMGVILIIIFGVVLIGLLAGSYVIVQQNEMKAVGLAKNSAPIVTKPAPTQSPQVTPVAETKPFEYPPLPSDVKWKKVPVSQQELSKNYLYVQDSENYRLSGPVPMTGNEYVSVNPNSSNFSVDTYGKIFYDKSGWDQQLVLPKEHLVLLNSGSDAPTGGGGSMSAFLVENGWIHVAAISHVRGKDTTESRIFLSDPIKVDEKMLRSYLEE